MAQPGANSSEPSSGYLGRGATTRAGCTAVTGRVSVGAALPGAAAELSESGAVEPEPGAVCAGGTFTSSGTDAGVGTEAVERCGGGVAGGRASRPDAGGDGSVPALRRACGRLRAGPVPASDFRLARRDAACRLAATPAPAVSVRSTFGSGTCATPSGPRSSPTSSGIGTDRVSIKPGSSCAVATASATTASATSTNLPLRRISFMPIRASEAGSSPP